MKRTQTKDVSWTAARDLRRESDSDTRDALVAAARRMFSAHGFDGATIRDITEDAGVSRPSFYAYFESKTEIFRAVAALLHSEVLEAHHYPPAVADDPVAVARASVGAFVAIYVDNLELLDEIRKRSESDPEVAAVFEEIVGKPGRRTLRHIIKLRDNGDAQPIVDERYASKVMRAVNLDAAAQSRADPERAAFFVDQATLVYLSIIGYKGDLTPLLGHRSQQSM